MTRFVIGLYLSLARKHLWPVAAELAEAGKLKEAAEPYAPIN